MIRYVLLFYSFTLSDVSKSIRVIECPEFRQLCMVLRESLDDADIPRRDKMREAILSYWRTSFEALKADLSVSLISIFPLHQLTLINSNPPAELVSPQMLGQA